MLPSIDVITGKDVPVEMRLNEGFHSLDEVVIRSGPKKDRTINDLASVSAYTRWFDAGLLP